MNTSDPSSDPPRGYFARMTTAEWILSVMTFAVLVAWMLNLAGIVHLGDNLHVAIPILIVVSLLLSSRRRARERRDRG